MAKTPGDSVGRASPGRVVRAVRIQKGWTLAELAQRTGVSGPALSRIENGKMSLSYDKLLKLSHGLGVDVERLFSESTSESSGAVISGRRSIMRAGEGKVIETAKYTHAYHATDLLHKKMVPVFVTLRARSIEEFGDLIRHPGEEYSFVLEGAVDFHSEIYAPVRLNVGDAIYFDSGMGHAYIAAASEPCRILCLCSGTEADVIDAMEGTAGTAKLATGGRPPARTSGTRVRKSRS